MIRNVILLSVLVLVGFGPALAQDIFIKKDTGEKTEEGAKPSIYNKPAVKKMAKKKPSSIKYKDKLNVHKQKLRSEEMMRTLAYWRENKAKPTNAQEILMYADANRAVAQNLMYERREELIKHLAKQDSKLRATLANKSRNALKVKDDKKSSSASKASEPEVEAPKKASKKPKLFVKSKEDKAKPTKVFTNYR